MYLNHPPFVSSITDTINSDSLINDPKVNSVASMSARKQGWRVAAVLLSTWHLPTPLSTSLIREVLTNRDHFPKLVKLASGLKSRAERADAPRYAHGKLITLISTLFITRPITDVIRDFGKETWNTISNVLRVVPLKIDVCHVTEFYTQDFFHK